MYAFGTGSNALDYLNRPHPGLDGQELPGNQHRDIKPQNLLLMGDMLKIGDFGLARALEASVASHTGGRTPAYAAPEFFEDKFTEQSDQYSLAVTWCMLCGGRLPFQGSEKRIMAGHLLSDPDLSMLPPTERYPVLRALSKQAKRRWPSCTEFVAALRAGVDMNALQALLQAEPMNAPLRRLYLSLRTPEMKERDRLSAHFPYRLYWNEWIGGPGLIASVIFLSLYGELSSTTIGWILAALLLFFATLAIERLLYTWQLRRKLGNALAEMGPLGQLPTPMLNLSLNELRRIYLEGQGTDSPPP